MSENILTLSKLQNLLEKIKEENGDIPIAISDADTFWTFPLKENHIQIGNSKELNSKILLIGIEYGDELID